MYFSDDPGSLNDCFATADAMYAAVSVSQDALGVGSSYYADTCPGESWKLAHADFCFHIEYEITGVTKVLNTGNGGKWGVWTNYTRCPAGSWASGISARVQPYQGWWNDDSGLNAGE